MPVLIRAVAVNGRPLNVDSAEVLTLSPDRDDPARTRFVLRDDVVTAQGRYEDWMTELAQDWSGHLA